MGLLWLIKNWRIAWRGAIRGAINALIERADWENFRARFIKEVEELSKEAGIEIIKSKDDN